jgi:hypothetical protein
MFRPLGHCGHAPEQGQPGFEEDQQAMCQTEQKSDSINNISQIKQFSSFTYRRTTAAHRVQSGKNFPANRQESPLTGNQPAHSAKS